MKDKIKDFLTTTLYFAGIIVVGVLWFSLTEGKLSNTTIGETMQVLAAIGGLCIFGFLAYIFIVTIYISIKEWFKRKVRQEAIQVIKEQKELEKYSNTRK